MSDELFKNKTISDVFEDIYENSTKKREQIDVFIEKLARMVTNATDAEVIAPIIKDFMEVKVKNDEHIVRVAQIGQRVLKDAASGEGPADTVLTDEEKRNLLNNFNSRFEDLTDEAEDVINRIKNE